VSEAQQDSVSEPTGSNHGPDPVRTLLPFLVLAAAHLPFGIMHYRSSWSLEHYQFFPFALGSFGWLIWTRRDPARDCWTWRSHVLLALDIALLLAGCVLYSPWLVTCGFAVGLCGLSLAVSEQGFSRSMFFLCYLPLLTVRLPLGRDTELISWLQVMTTNLASGIGHRIGLIHFTEGNAIKVPGRSFLVAEACSGVNSLFTIMFIAAFVVATQRRSVLHGLMLLFSGFVVAGIMNTVRVLSVILVWDIWQFDIATGWVHDALGYVVLLIAAGFLLSGDLFFHWLTDRVPDIRRPGIMSIYRNPLIRLWNRFAAPGSEQKSASLKPIMLSSRLTLVFGGIGALAVVGQIVAIVSGKVSG
jgi:exosortase